MVDQIVTDKGDVVFAVLVLALLIIFSAAMLPLNRLLIWVKLKQIPQRLQHIGGLLFCEVELILDELEVVGLVFSQNVEGIVVDSFGLIGAFGAEVPLHELKHALLDFES